MSANSRLGALAVASSGPGASRPARLRAEHHRGKGIAPAALATIARPMNRRHTQGLLAKRLLTKRLDPGSAAGWVDE